MDEINYGHPKSSLAVLRSSQQVGVGTAAVNTGFCPKLQMAKMLHKI